MNLRSRYLALAALAFSMAAPGCLFRSHRVESNISKTPLLTSTGAQVVEKLNSDSNTIRTMNATVDINTSVGGVKKGMVTEYSAISGYILAEKPAMLRMIGLVPVVRTRAFDMVSNGREFELWIPAKNKVIVGPDEVVKPSANPLENLRPRIILEALLLRSVDADEIAVLEAGEQRVADSKAKKTLEQPNYKLDIIRKNAAGGQWFLSRRLYFDRTDLHVYRQVIFDRRGEIETDASYSDFQEFQGVRFPMQITIKRPQEEYTIGLKITKLALNEALKPEQFVLQRPEGVQTVHLNESGGASAVPAPQP